MEIVNLTSCKVIIRNEEFERVIPLSGTIAHCETGPKAETLDGIPLFEYKMPELLSGYTQFFDGTPNKAGVGLPLETHGRAFIVDPEVAFQMRRSSRTDLFTWDEGECIHKPGAITVKSLLRV